MREADVSKAGEVLEELVDSVCATHQPVWLARDGRRVAVLIALEDYNELLLAAGRTPAHQELGDKGRVEEAAKRVAEKSAELNQRLE
ncbi:type II toxin-antitoxin system Phd/YefM family antitoxin [Sinomonas sp. RB5]